MKKIFVIVLIVGCIFCGYIEGKAASVSKQDRKQITRFIRETYGKGYKIRIKAAEKTTDKQLANRAGKKIVFVDLYRTKAINSKFGKVTTKGPFKGNIIRYAHKAKKGRLYKVYYIYNPNTNYTDDTIAIVSNGKLKTE